MDECVSRKECFEFNHVFLHQIQRGGKTWDLFINVAKQAPRSVFDSKAQNCDGDDDQ